MHSLFKLDTTDPLKIEEMNIEYKGNKVSKCSKIEYVISFQDEAAGSMSSLLSDWKR